MMTQVRGAQPFKHGGDCKQVVNLKQHGEKGRGEGAGLSRYEQMADIFRLRRLSFYDTALGAPFILFFSSRSSYICLHELTVFIS